MAKNNNKTNEPVVIKATTEVTEDTALPLKRINKPEAKVKREYHTIEDFAKGLKHKRTSRIAAEFENGLDFIRKYDKSVTIYGSARFKQDNVHYKDARALAARFAKEGYAVLTGGGPGIMEAANRGAKEAGGDSLGLNIELPFEQNINPYVTDSMSFYYFFSRKTTMSFAAESYIYYPGGFGTLDELFEILTLVQTRKIRKIPIFLVGTDFWAPMQDFIESVIFRDHGAIDKKDMDLYVITDDHDLIIKTVMNAPIYK